MPDTVKLGDHTIPVIPQRHAYLTHRLGPAFVNALSSGSEITAESVLDWAGGGTYDVLCVLIPAVRERIPRHEFLGFKDADALAADLYDENADKSPDLTEIIAAFRVALKVNGIDELVSLGKGIFDPKLVKAKINLALAEAFDSQNSPLTSGASDSTSSSTTRRTSSAKRASRSAGSKA